MKRIPGVDRQAKLRTHAAAGLTRENGAVAALHHGGEALGRN